MIRAKIRERNNGTKEKISNRISGRLKRVRKKRRISENGKRICEGSGKKIGH